MKYYVRVIMQKISVIIPAYNVERVISKTIENVLSQNFPEKNFEVIVVNDGSTDDTKKVVSGFKEVRLVNIKHGGAGKARNAGAKKARGSIFAFTDAGCVPDKHWLEYLVGHFDDPEVSGVGGSYKTLNKESWVARFVGYEIEQRHQKMKGNIDFVGTYSCAYRKSAFKNLGGFSESYRNVADAEDADFSFRMKKKGFKIIYEPKASVSGDHPDSLLKYLLKKKKRAYWKVLLYKKHPEKTLENSYTPKTLFPQIILTILFIFSGMLSLLSLNFVYLSLISLITSLLLNIDFYKFVWKKEKRIAFISPFIFFLRNIFSLVGISQGIVHFFLN